MTSLTSYRPYRFPRYPGRSSTISRGQLSPSGQIYQGRVGVPHIDGLCPTAASLLIVESDANRSRALEALLESWRFRTVTCTDDAFDSNILKNHSCDLVLLDGFVPDEACRQFIATARSIGRDLLIFATSSCDYDRLEAICRGNGKIMPPDWRSDELRQTITAFTDRGAGSTADESSGELYSFSGWTIDLQQHLIMNDRSEILILSAGEFSLLRAFVTRPRRVLTRNQLLDIVTSVGSEITDRVIDTQISRLRRRLGENHHFIRTIRNEGYMFTERVHKVVPD